VGALSGGLFGLLVGAAFLIVPGIGPVIIAGPLAAAGYSEELKARLGGAAMGGLAGALVGTGRIQRQGHSLRGGREDWKVFGNA